MSLSKFYHKEEQKDDLFSSNFLTKFLLPLGTVLIAAITFLTVKGILPDWSAIGLIAIYFVALLLSLLNKPIGRLYFSYRMNRRNKYLSKHFYPWLWNIEREFSRMIEDRSDNLFYFFDGLIRNNTVQLDMEHISTIRSWLLSVRERLNYSQPKDFKQLAWDLSSIISQYHRFCVNGQQRLEDLIRQGKISEGEPMRSLKQGWNLRREAHMHFLNQLKNVAKNINDIAGERVCIDYFESLKTLE